MGGKPVVNDQTNDERPKMKAVSLKRHALSMRNCEPAFLGGFMNDSLEILERHHRRFGYESPFVSVVKVKANAKFDINAIIEFEFLKDNDLAWSCG